MQPVKTKTLGERANDNGDEGPDSESTRQASVSEVTEHWHPTALSTLSTRESPLDSCPSLSRNRDVKRAAEAG